MDPSGHTVSDHRPETRSSMLARALVAELAEDADALGELRDLLTGPPTGVRLLTPEEAADRLGIHVNTLRKAARAGRVVGAERQGVKLWRFRPDILALLPPERPADLGPAGPGRGRRREAGSSSAARAIRGAAA